MGASPEPFVSTESKEMHRLVHFAHLLEDNFFFCINVVLAVGFLSGSRFLSGSLVVIL